MPVTHEIKSQLAKLLATEDLIVEHKQVETAQFNVHTRELILPLWNASGTVYDMLVAHEVGHALFTPDVDWSKEIKVPQSFVNVVEDVRIEKLMKRKYAGLLKTFYKGYSELSEKDFFQIEGEDVDDFNLADRINLFAKIGSFVDISFNDKEREILSMVKNCETFDQVLKASEILYDYCKVETEENAKLDNIQTEENETDEEEVVSQGSDTDQSGNDTEEEEEVDSNPSTSSSKSEEEPEVRTEDSFTRSINDLVDHNGVENVYVKRPQVYLDEVIASNEDVHKELDMSFLFQQKQEDERQHGVSNLFEEVDVDYDKFRKEAKKEINYLVKEFECRKSASSYARATTSRTGVLDTTKLQTYKFNEDLFKKVTVLPDGKNHGLIFILDWSGSMAEVILDTIKQLYNLILFCKKVGIPFDVYAFTNEWNRSRIDYETGHVYPQKCEEKYKKEEYVLRIDDDFSLLHLFTNNTNKAVFEHQLRNVYRLANCFGRRYDPTRYVRYTFPWKLALSGTPLNETILCLHDIIPQFQKKNGVEKVQCVMLTDGEAQQIPYHVEVQRRWDDEPHLGCRNINARLCSLRDRKLGRVYNFGWSFYEFTDTLLKNLKDNFPSTNFIGFRVLEKRDTRTFIQRYTSATEYETVMNEYKKTKTFTLKNSAFDSYFGISGSSLNEDFDFDVAEDATKAQIKRAFAKSLKVKKLNKKILSEFVELVA